MRLRLRWTGLALLLTGCGVGTGTLDEVDPEAAPATPTYTADIAPMMEWYCTNCHGKDATFSGVSNLPLETCRQVSGWRGGVRSTVLDAQNMPPGGAPRLTSWEALTLDRWLRQGAKCD